MAAINYETREWREIF